MTTEGSILQNPYSLILKSCLPRPWKMNGRYWNNGSTDVDFFLLPHQIEVWFSPTQTICVGHHLEGWRYVFDVNDPEIVTKLREGLLKMAKKKRRRKE